MDENINIVKAQTSVIYTPHEVAYIFKKQLKTLAKVVTIEGGIKAETEIGQLLRLLL